MNHGLSNVLSGWPEKRINASDDGCDEFGQLRMLYL
jgi:hypothetical protein